MRTNIRLFVPNTTEVLDFEYGLLIHHMAYNEYRAQSQIGLRYYELAEIDPITHGLDIVQQHTITEITRSHCKIDGFTLDSHYTLSFDQNFNNDILTESVRQVWLWLHCKNSTEYHFLLEKFSDSEEKIVSNQNQLFVRLWSNLEWQSRNLNPQDQNKINSRLDLISLMQQGLSAQFDQIEQENRQKLLAALQLQAAPVSIDAVVNLPKPNIIIDEYIPTPIIKEIEPSRALSNRYILLLQETQKTIQSLGQAELRLSVMQAEIVKIKSSKLPLEPEYLTTSSACVLYIQNFVIKTIAFYANAADDQILKPLEEQSLKILTDLLHFDMHETTRTQLLLDIQSMQKIKILPVMPIDLAPEPEPIYIAISPEDMRAIEQPKLSNWWIWPVIIIIGFMIDVRAGVALIVAAVIWYIIKFIFSSPILLFIIVVMSIFGFFWL